jgi:hypothetical protein
MKITKEEYEKIINELKERDFDLFWFSFNDNFLTKENVEKGLNSPDVMRIQYNYTVNLMCGDLKQILARIRRTNLKHMKKWVNCVLFNRHFPTH